VVHGKDGASLPVISFFGCRADVQGIGFNVCKHRHESLVQDSGERAHVGNRRTMTSLPAGKPGKRWRCNRRRSARTGDGVLDAIHPREAALEFEHLCSEEVEKHVGVDDFAEKSLLQIAVSLARWEGSALGFGPP